MVRIKQLYKKTIRFITKDIWTFDEKTSKWLRGLKSIVITINSFTQNRMGLQASALTFLSIIALVPLMAFIYSFTSALGYAQMLEDFLYRNLDGLEAAVKAVLNFANNIIQSSRSGLLGFISALAFFWTVLWLIMSIEKAFNRVWQVDKNRSLAHRIVYYAIVLLAIPILLVIAAMFTLMYSSALDKLPIAPYFISSFKPVFGWIAFTLLILLLFYLAYKYIPNTKVKNWPAFSAALIITIAFIFVQILYLETQFLITRMNAIYGIFAAVPLFMIWLNIDYYLILFGAELSYGFQNIDCYEYDKATKNTRIFYRKAVALLITRMLCLKFKRERLPASAEEMAEELMLPTRMINIALKDLCSAGILIEVFLQKDNISCYQPAIDIDKLTVAYVIRKIEMLGEARITRYAKKDMKTIVNVLNQADKLFAESPYNKLLIEL